MKRTGRSCGIDHILAEHTQVASALRRATIEAFRRHQQAGVPVAIWRGGRVVWADPAKLLKKLEADGNGRVRRRRKPA